MTYADIRWTPEARDELRQKIAATPSRHLREIVAALLDCDDPAFLLPTLIGMIEGAELRAADRARRKGREGKR